MWTEAIAGIPRRRAQVTARCELKSGLAICTICGSNADHVVATPLNGNTSDHELDDMSVKFGAIEHDLRAGLRGGRDSGCLRALTPHLGFGACQLLPLCYRPRSQLSCQSRHQQSSHLRLSLTLPFQRYDHTLAICVEDSGILT